MSTKKHKIADCFKTVAAYGIITFASMAALSFFLFMFYDIYNKSGMLPILLLFGIFLGGASLFWALNYLDRG